MGIIDLSEAKAFTEAFLWILNLEFDIDDIHKVYMREMSDLKEKYSLISIK